MLRRHPTRRTRRAPPALGWAGRRLPAWLRDRLRRLLSVAAKEWQGPPDLPSNLTIEWRLIVARWLGITFVAPALPLLNLSTQRLFAAYAIIAFAASYNLAVRYSLARRPQLFANGYITTIADSMTNVAMVLIGGGFNSPMSYFLFTVSISVAMRYGYGPSMAMTMFFVGCDAIEELLLGQRLDASFAFRSCFLSITAILASYLRRLTVSAEMALQERLVELQRLYADLAVAHQELLSLDEAKTNFLANVSHELRTPLTSIRAFSEMLLEYDDDEEVKREFLGIISSESDRLTRLVNDVLDVTKIEAGQMDWRDETIDLGVLLDECARGFAPLVEQAGLVFQQELARELPPISGDRDRLQQVIHNLLNNALKFTSEGTITLRAAATADEVCIAVSDTGVGIASADHERVFEKFQQVGDTLTGKPKGTGLGLTICRDIVAHHGGTLTLASVPSQGSTFTITLPTAAAPAAPLGPASSAPERLAA
jgi:signal transduction histidine kinase